MNDSLARRLSAALGSTVRTLVPVAGGDINDAFMATLSGGERLFVKTRDDAPHGMYQSEAEGLVWLTETKTLPTPAIQLVHDEFLVLQFVERAARGPDFDERLGGGLAQLHAFGAPMFGLQRDNFIATLPQDNTSSPHFHDFYRERRLMPLVERAHERGLLEARDQHAFDRLYTRLPSLIPDEPPARLHGDLWSGNVFTNEKGQPMLIDPAVYGGQREIDLAMLQLFGAPSARMFAAYDASYPRAPGHAERVALWQLYPLLVHVCLFGSAYVAQLRSALQRYV